MKIKKNVFVPYYDTLSRKHGKKAFAISVLGLKQHINFLVNMCVIWVFLQGTDEEWFWKLCPINIKTRWVKPLKKKKNKL